MRRKFLRSVLLARIEFKALVFFGILFLWGGIPLLLSFIWWPLAIIAGAYMCLGLLCAIFADPFEGDEHNSPDYRTLNAIKYCRNEAYVNCKYKKSYFNCKYKEMKKN